MGGTTGTSLKQGLGLTDLFRGRPEASVALYPINMRMGLGDSVGSEERTARLGDSSVVR